MCKYCESKSELVIPFYHDEYDCFVLINRNLIEFNDIIDGQNYQCDIKINFCPMCARKLSE